MKKRYVSIFIIFFSLLCVTAPLFAASNADLNRQIESIKKDREALVQEQQRLQAELEAVTRESQSIGTAVKSLDSTRKKLAADIKVTQSKISSTDLNIKVLENNVSNAEKQIRTHQKAVESALQKISNYDSRPLLLDLIASANFSELWQDRSELASLTGTLGDEVKSLHETKNVLTLEKKEKEKVKQEIVSLNRELAGQKVVVEESQKAKEKLLAETKNKEALYQAMLAENLARQKQFESDLYKLESEIKFNLDSTKIPEARPGLLSWPLDTVFVTQKFGKTVGAARLYASGSHNGADLRASQGTPVKAMMSGRVVGTGNTDEQKGCYSYGGWVLIEHGNGLSSIYGHLSVRIVTQGQEVNTGDVIGYSGGTPRVFGSGYSTGPHLHIGLFASQGVEVRQFVSSNNCKQVSVPIASVEAYLDPLAYLPAI